MRISDWSSDVCSSDLRPRPPVAVRCARPGDLGLLDLLVEDVARKVEIDGAGLAGDRLAEGAVDELRNPPRVVDPLRPFPPPAQCRALVDLLAPAPAVFRHRAGHPTRPPGRAYQPT